MKSRLVFVALAASSVAFPLACSKKPPPPVTPTVSIDGGADASDDGGLEGGAAPIATGPAFFTDGGTPAPDAGPPAVAVDAADLVIDTTITTASAKLAPKMEKEGQPGRATLAQGEHFNMLVTMTAGRCYTIVGYSPAGGVTQLDLKLYAPPFYNVESGKSGTSDKNQPVMGKGAQAICPIIPLPVAYKVDAVATKGAGRIGVYVFARNK